jgi:hypothetical protein
VDRLAQLPLGDGLCCCSQDLFDALQGRRLAMSGRDIRCIYFSND